MSLSVALLLMLSSYVVAGLALFFALSRARVFSGSVNLALIPLSFGLGPLLIAFVEEVLLRLGLFVNPSTNFQLVFGLLFLLVVVQLGRRSILVNHLLEFKRILYDDRWTFLSVIFLLLSAMFILVCFLDSYLFPLTGNDSLEYATTARLMFANGNLDNYPYIDTRFSGGYYGPWTHPLGYVNLMLWGYVVQGGAENAGVIQFIAPYYGLFAWLLIGSIVYEHTKNLLASMVASFMFVVTPFSFQLVLDSHIDPIRLFALLAFVYVFFVQLRHPPKMGTALITGFALGMALYTHSINVVLIPLFLIIAIFFSIARKDPPRDRVLWMLLATVVSLVPVLPIFITNVLVFGNVIADASAVPIWSIESLQYDEYFKIIRRIELASDRIIFGLFKPLFAIGTYGFAYSGMLVLLLFLVGKRRDRLRAVMELSKVRLSSVFAWVLLGYYGMVVTSLLLEFDIFIKNDRYMLTMHPVVCVLIGLMVDQSLQHLPEGGLASDKPVGRFLRVLGVCR